MNSNIWLKRFSWLAAAGTLVLIWSGGLVTSRGAGLAVPDWPNSFGYNMFLFPVSHWIGAIFYEHTHRLIASTVGFLTLILAEWMWMRETRGAARWIGCVVMVFALAVLGIRQRDVHIAIAAIMLTAIGFGLWQSIKFRTLFPWLGVVALAAVVLQGVLGGLRVTMLTDEIGIFHACLAQAFFSLLVFVAFTQTGVWKSLGNDIVNTRSTFRWFKTIALATTAAVYLQLAIGATMRHQHRDLAVLDFPTANGAWIPDTSPPALAKINAWRDARGLSDVTAFQIWLHMAHRFIALIIAAGVIALFFRLRREVAIPAILRRLSGWWLIVLFSQITLGAWTVWSNKAADIATAHVAVGAIMLSFGVIISAICCRLWPRAFLATAAAESIEGKDAVAT